MLLFWIAVSIVALLVIYGFHRLMKAWTIHRIRKKVDKNHIPVSEYFMKQYADDRKRRKY